jgi:hypothetical protein
MSRILLLGLLWVLMLEEGITQTFPGLQDNTSASSRRFALVIGNAHYQNGINLKNPEHDAEDLAAVLREAQFQVILKKNAGYLEILRGIQELSDSLHSGDFYLVYFAGLGFRDNDQNYVVPVDAKMVTAMEGVPISRLFPTKGKHGALLLDANFTGLKGDERVNSLQQLIPDSPQENALIFYAGMGLVMDGNGNNSPFNIALRQFIEDQEQVYLHPEQQLDLLQGLSIVAAKIEKSTQGQQSPLLVSRFYQPFYLHLYR